MALTKFTWENGTLVEPAKVEVGGVSYNVTDAQYEGETPLSAANLNLMQDTLLGNVKDDLTDETKIPSVKAVKGKVLWTNLSPTADFAEQDITLSSDDYDILEFFFRSDVSGNRVDSVRVLKGYGIEFDMYSTSSATRTWRRRGAFTNNTKYHFENCGQLEQGQTTSTHNEYCVPLYVIGYKTGLFS